MFIKQINIMHQSKTDEKRKLVEEITMKTLVSLIENAKNYNLTI